MNQVNNGNNITNAKKWKVLNEKDRYNIELLIKEGYKRIQHKYQVGTEEQQKEK